MFFGRCECQYAVDWVDRLVSEMVCSVSSATLQFTESFSRVTETEIPDQKNVPVQSIGQQCHKEETQSRDKLVLNSAFH